MMPITLQPDMRDQGRAAFNSLNGRFPLTMAVGGSRGLLRALPAMVALLPRTPRSPWHVDLVNENGNVLELAYLAEETWVDYYLGFIEAVVEHFGDVAFILVRTLKNELRFKVAYAS
jgi:hypothetical protein